LLSVDGKYIEKFRAIPLEVILKDAKTFQVERDGQKLNIPIPPDFAGNLIRYKALNFIDVRLPFNGLDSVNDGSAAYKAGLRKGDKILAVNGQPTPYFSDFKNQVRRNVGKSLEMTVLKGNDTLQLRTVVPEDAILGITASQAKDEIEIKTLRYTFLQSFPAGFRKSIETLESYWLQLKLIFSKKVKTSESLGSVISIGKMFPSEWDWQTFWGLTAFFSLVLALMNILPIPALDGGHALFTIYEMITGRKPGDKFIEYAQMVGMVLLLGLMAYALGLDIFRLFK
jgi:regulator of sigma E protease